MRWVNVGFSTSRKESYTSICELVIRPCLRLNIGRGFAHNRMHVAFTDLFKERGGAVIFSQRFLPFFESFERRSAVADRRFPVV